MRTVRPMTEDERKFAERKHDLVMDFLRYRHLPMSDFYDVVIFGYLSAVQQYLRTPPAGVDFKTMAFRAMKDSVLRDGEYHVRAKRCGCPVSLEEVGGHDAISDPRQDTERQAMGNALLDQVVRAAMPGEAQIIHLLMDGFTLHEAAHSLKIPRSVAESYVDSFCCRARAAIG